MRTKLEKRCLELSYENKLSHLSSVLNSVDIIDHIYNTKKKDDVFVLGNSHAAVALYAVLEKNKLANAQDLVEKHGTHACRDLDNGIWVSGGSLGQAETIAVGLAIADPTTNVYLLTSDGACTEGAIWESLGLAREMEVENLRITVVANGHGAYSNIDVEDLDSRLNAFYPTLVVRTHMFEWPDWLQGTAGHYVVMTKEQYKEALE